MTAQQAQQYRHDRIEDQRRNNSLIDLLGYYHPDKMVAILHVGGGTPDTIEKLTATVIHRFLKKTSVKTLLELRTDFKQLHFVSLKGIWFITLTALYDSDKAKERVEGSRLDYDTWYKV